MSNWVARALLVVIAAMALLPLAGCTVKDIVPMPWLQIPAVIAVIAIIIGWVIYRRRQM